MAESKEGLHQPAPVEKTGPLVGSLNLPGNGASSSAVPVGLSAHFWLEGSVLKCEGVLIDARGKILRRKPVELAQNPIVAKFFAFFQKLVS